MMVAGVSGTADGVAGTCKGAGWTGVGGVCVGVVELGCTVEAAGIGKLDVAAGASDGVCVTGFA